MNSGRIQQGQAGGGTRFRIGGKKTKVVTFGDGDVEPAFGLFGGKESTLNKIELEYPDGTVYTATSKDLVENVPQGATLFQQAGGGYGDPCLRDPAKVATEVKNGIISVEKARSEYGIVIDPQTFVIDWSETKKIREKWTKLRF